VTYDSVALFGCVLGLASILPGWFSLKPNRIASGDSFGLWDSAGIGFAAALLCLWIACLVLSLGSRGSRSVAVRGVAANLILVVVFFMAGTTATSLLEGQASFARVSLGAGFWLSLLAAYVLVFASRQRLHDRWLRFAITWVGLAAAAALLFSGWLSDLSAVQEVSNNAERFREWTLNHLLLAGGSVAAGTLIAVPLGIWAERSGRAERPVFFFSNITQTIPALALFGFLIAPLSALSDRFPFLEELGIRGVGLAPAMIALVVYCLLPIVRNTYTALRQVDPAVIDAGLGMGMSRWRVFRRIEVVLAASIVIEGIRIASVQAVGLATLAALIGYQTLGTPVFRGLEGGASDLVIAGSIPIIALALVVDGVMRALARVTAPKGLVGEAA
jgi:osmoprotectant transport system permease protein